jgi:hypothetical protein
VSAGARAKTMEVKKRWQKKGKDDKKRVRKMAQQRDVGKVSGLFPIY